MKPRLLLFALTATNALAVDYTWDGLNGSTPSSSWTTAGNWTGGVVPTLGSTFAADRLVIANGSTGLGAIYNPGAGVTTTFGSGRALLVGSTGAGSLTITSGTLKTTGGANSPVMANGNSASLLINGGTLDVTGNTSPFVQILNGLSGVTSVLTVSSGSFVGNGFDLYNNNTNLGTGTLNLDGGTFGVTGFSRSAVTGTGTSTINFNGGTLQARAASTTFLNNLFNTTAVVKSGGAKVDTNSFDITIAAPLTHDTGLGATADGGLTKGGNGVLTLSGNNSYTGATAINVGGINLAHANGLGSTAGSTTVASGAWLALTGGITSAAESITIAGDGNGFRGALQSASGANTWAGSVSFSGTGNNRIGVQDGASLSISGNITESTAGSRIIFRPGGTSGSDITLTGTGNSWSGTTEIWGGSGVVKLGLANALPTTSLLSLGNSGTVGGTLDLNGFNQSSAGVTQFGGTLGKITNNGATDATITLQGLASNSSFGGSITDGSTNKVALTLNSSGKTQTLAGTSTYTGATTVSAGTLLITGALGNTAVSVSSGAFLINNGTIGGTVSSSSTATVSGTGTFTGAATINGALNPGNSPGFQSYGDSLTLGSTANTTFELGGLSRSTLLLNGTGYYDAINVATTLTLDGTINVSWFGGFTAAEGDSFNLFDATTFNASGFTVGSDLVLPTLGIGLFWDTSSFTTNGVISVVPEPGAALLGGLGLLAMLRRRRA